MSTGIYFVRHGQTITNRRLQHSGRIDTALTTTGANQAADCRHLLSKIHFDAVYCSPLHRARQTAAIATLYLSDLPKIVIDDRLIERDLGRLEGKFAPFAAHRIWNYDASYTKTHYGEETLLALELRVEDFLEMLRLAHPDQTVLIFSHGGIATTIYTLLSTDHTRTGNFFKYFHLKNGEIVYFCL